MWFLITHGGGAARVRRLAIIFCISSSVLGASALLGTWLWHWERCRPLQQQITINQQLLARAARPASQPFSFSGSLTDIAQQVRAQSGDIVRAWLVMEVRLPGQLFAQSAATSEPGSSLMFVLTGTQMMGESR